MKDPNGEVLDKTVSLNSLGIDDVYDLDILETTDTLFKPFQPMELVADFWSRVHIVKYAQNPDAVIAIQYSADMRPGARILRSSGSV